MFLLQIFANGLFFAFFGALCYLVGIGIRNYKAQLIFKQKKPSLPELPNKKLFSGHLDMILHERNWQILEKLHEQHGKTFGAFYANKPFVSTIDLDFVKQFVIDEPYAHVNRYNPSLPIEELGGDDIHFARDEQWLKVRKLVSPAFAKHKLDTSNVTEEIEKVIGRLVESFDWRLTEEKKRNGNLFVEIEVEDVFHRYAIDLVFTCFYKQPNIIDYKVDKDWWRSTVDECLRDLVNPVVGFCVMFPIINRFAQWLLMTFFPQRILITELMKFIRQQTRLNFEARRQMAQADMSKQQMDQAQSFTLNDGSKFKRNMVDYVADRMFEGKLTEKEYLHSSWFLFMAANKTTADALSKLILQLALDQRVQDKLRASIMSSGEQSEYLNWVINESMRLFPPALTGCGREVTRDFLTEAGVVPAGSFVYTPAHLIHRLKQYWGQDAEEFKPERWARAENFHPIQFLPFGAGKRYCLGKNFALHELRMLLTVLLRRFRFDPSPNTDADKVMTSFTSPGFIFCLNDLPTYVRIQHLDSSRL